MAQDTSTVTVLIEVVDRATGKALMPTDEVAATKNLYESDSGLLDRVKTQYSELVAEKIKFMPVVRKKLTGRDWCLEAVVV